MNFRERYTYDAKADLLGKGGFAQVFRAKDKLLNRTVALKFYISDSGSKHSLIQEISKVIQLEHPNLCRYYDAVTIDGKNLHGENETTEVGIMEYLDGGDLRTAISADPKNFHHLMTDVLQGLSYLHKKGIIHRDLKPTNILIKSTEAGPVAKITDFGISKLMDSSTSSSSALLGTIEYMAPEQFNPHKYGINGRVSTNLDLWSFGVMLYELQTGHSLFNEKINKLSSEQVMGNILDTSYALKKIAILPPLYRHVVEQCIIKNASRRAAFAEDLLQMMNQDRTVVHANKTQFNISPSSGYKKKLPWLLYAGIVLVACVGVYVLMKKIKNKNEQWPPTAIKDTVVRKLPEAREPVKSAPNNKPVSASRVDTNGKLIFVEDCYIIVTGSFVHEADVINDVRRMRNEGYSNSGYLWIPDYPSLSGKPFFAPFIGPFVSYEECREKLISLSQTGRFWYGKKVSMKAERVEIRL